MSQAEKADANRIAPENADGNQAGNGGEEEVNLTGAEKRSLLGRLLRYMFRYRGRLAVGIVLSLMVSFTNLFSLTTFVPIFNALGAEGPVTPFTIGDFERKKLERFNRGEDLPVYDALSARVTAVKARANAYFVNRSSNEAILILCMVLIPVMFLKIICAIGTLYFIGTAGLMAVRDLRMELYGQMNELSIEFFQTQRTGFIMSRIINDVELVGKSLSMEFNDALNNLFFVVTHVALLAFISWEMMFITFVIIPIIMAPISKFATKIRKAAGSMQERLADMGSHVQEILSGIRVIRAFSMEKFERARFSKINEELYGNTFKNHYYYQIGPAITEFASSLVMVGFIAWGAYKITGGGLDRGKFFAFFFTLTFIMRPMKQLSIMVNLLSTAAVAANRIFQFLDMKPGVTSPPDAVPFSKAEKGIAYENVSFKYPGSDTYSLKDVSFNIEPGKTIALVGSSGAGKSTLVDLLPRLYDPSQGRILIDDVDIRELNLRDLRRSIGVVTQSIFLFNANIHENISYGRSDIPFSRIIEVAKAANAHEFITKLPQGYETPIGERGVMLSGGQRQRIAIARALLRNPPMLVFDEATSALDNESEMLVQQAIERLLKGRTVLMIHESNK